MGKLTKKQVLELMDDLNLKATNNYNKDYCTLVKHLKSLGYDDKKKGFNDRQNFIDSVTGNDIMRIDLHTKKTDSQKQRKRRKLNLETIIKESNLDKKQFNDEMIKYIKRMRNEISFETNIAENLNKRKAFIQAIRYLVKEKLSTKNPGICINLISEDLKGEVRNTPLNEMNMKNIDKIIKHFDGEIKLEDTYISDPEVIIGNIFNPVKFSIEFMKYDRKKKSLIKRRINKNKKKSSSDDEIIDEEIDLDMYQHHDGNFFAYINLSPIDLSDYQIYDCIKKENYYDSCFVYSCIQSGLLNDNEIDSLRSIIMTRKFPRRLIHKIAKILKIDFKISRIDENLEVRHQIILDVNTTKLKKPKYDRLIEIVLYKEHYMIKKPIYVTKYYIHNFKELDAKYPQIPKEQRQMICRTVNDKIYYAENPMQIQTVIREMFRQDLFREITKSEHDIIRTQEFKRNLKDYESLDYEKSLCTREIKRRLHFKEWSMIYYSDFETDVSKNPHEAYLNCTIFRNEDNKVRGKSFFGKDCGLQLLDYLKDGSLTYFHNLKYDACFFVNSNTNYTVEALERSGTTLQIVLKKKKGSKILKTLTFRNSYSLIPKPLRDFGNMFKLKVHKEVMPYKLYTEDNINRKYISVEEFKQAYINENADKIDIQEDLDSIVKNAMISKSLVSPEARTSQDSENNNIDIMKYAEFYCRKDCMVLMQGVEKFDSDISKVFEEYELSNFSIHDYISISSIGYSLAVLYGCMDDCYELSGKPQDFLLRCVNGGRTMTANNKKLIVNDKLLDFDAVSLYPSAMSIMDGIPKGIPKVINKNDNIFVYDAFYVEIKITDIKCKSNKDYQFGLVWKYNDEGSKIYCNDCVNSFYIDKRGLLDLLEYYDMKYEVIRGYYFNDGFNNKINSFIKNLFDLRVQYKNDNNPLQETIKLLLNSIYGKSILKAIPVQTKIIRACDIDKYIIQHYNYIEDIKYTKDSNNYYAKEIKSIVNHFNLPQFGINVLSWSKHIMNQVICTSEQNDIAIYYQDTDSIHIRAEDLPILEEIYENKYHKKLCGKNLCQFHSDFAPFENSVGEIHSKKLIALGKKSYIDILEDENGNTDYHIRLKGIPNQVIKNYCKNNDISIEDLYMKMYNSEEIAFDLTDGTNCFRKTCCYEQMTMENFVRRVKF